MVLLSVMFLGIAVMVSLGRWPGQSRQVADLTASGSSTGGSEMGIAEIQGDWTTELIAAGGAAIPMSIVRIAPNAERYHPFLAPAFRGSKWIDLGPDGTGTAAVCTIRAIPSGPPKQIDLLRANGIVRGIYHVEADVLELALNVRQGSAARPSSFSTSASESTVYLRCRRFPSPDDQIANAADRVEKAEEAFSLQDLSADTLKHYSQNRLVQMHRIYKSQFDDVSRMADGHARTTDILLQFATITSAMKLEAIDRWSDRERSGSLAGVITNGIRRAADEDVRRLESYQVAIDRLQKHLDLVSAQQVINGETK